MPTSSQDRSEIGSRIRQLRRAQELTIQELAVAAGLSGGHLSEVERGQSALTGEKLSRIALSLRCTTDYLLTGQESIQRNQKEALHVPAELSEAAIQLNLSYETTMRLLQARQSLVASRRRTEGEAWPKEKWISFYERVKDYLGGEAISNE